MSTSFKMQQITERQRKRKTKRNANSLSSELAPVYLFCFHMFYFLAVIILTNKLVTLKNKQTNKEPHLLVQLGNTR